MAHILVLDSIQQDVFVCGICKSVYNSLQMFLDHKNIMCGKQGSELDRSHQAIQINNVDITNETVTLGPHNNETRSAASDAHSIKDISCKQCKKKFKKTKALLAHLKTHNDNSYQCLICGRCFVQNSHLQRHTMCHKVWPDGLSETTAKSTGADLLSYTCSYCNMTLANYNQFRAHLKIHLSLKKFKCIQGECANFYDSIESLLTHVSLVHKNLKYSCYMCIKSFESLEDIAYHYQNHDNDKDVNSTSTKQYKCSQCDATFKRPEKLSLHKLTENHKKKCIHCSKTFASDKRLRLHLQIHRKQKPFQCSICKSSFHMKKYLSTHMLKHGDRQFTCANCKHTFKRQDLLQRHMKLHQMGKLLKCPFKDTLDCKKEFSRNDKLKSHIKFHTKHLTVGSNVNKPVQENDGSTVEICIVPLDTKNKDI